MSRYFSRSAYEEANRLVKEQREYEDYKPQLSDEEFIAQWKEACKCVRRGIHEKNKVQIG